MPKLIIFAVVSVAIVLLSWKSLRNLRSHGFFRFFAFECILLLILANIEYWFREPFSALQVISWLLLLSSLVLAIHGFHLLRVIGRPKDGIEDTSVLVRRGAYNYIRHPLYSSLLLFAWGTFLKAPSLLSTLLAVAVTTFLVATARVEEMENIQKFGDGYVTYMKETKMFIPFLI
jgi:protein-S-isoprenylcysteine O-methyltransferase Ste14